MLRATSTCESSDDPIPKELRTYQTLSEDELFVLLGVQLRLNHDALRHSDDDDSGVGRQYFLSKYQQIRQAVCGAAVVQELLAGKRTEDIELVAMVAGVLGEHFDKVVATLTAVLVVRRGLAALCSTVK